MPGPGPAGSVAAELYLTRPPAWVRQPISNSGRCRDDLTSEEYRLPTWPTSCVRSATPRKERPLP
jgi:hypothetical protein